VITENHFQLITNVCDQLKPLRDFVQHTGHNEVFSVGGKTNYLSKQTEKIIGTKIDHR